MEAHIWSKQYKEGEEGFDKVSQYVFYTDSSECRAAGGCVGG